MERVTATFDRETLSAIRRAAGRRGVSRFLQEAARERLARLELLGLLDELDARHGAPSHEMRLEIEADASRIFGPPPVEGRRSTKLSISAASGERTSKRKPRRGLR